MDGKYPANDDLITAVYEDDFRGVRRAIALGADGMDQVIQDKNFVVLTPGYDGFRNDHNEYSTMDGDLSPALPVRAPNNLKIFRYLVRHGTDVESNLYASIWYGMEYVNVVLEQGGLGQDQLTEALMRLFTQDYPDTDTAELLVTKGADLGRIPTVFASDLDLSNQASDLAAYLAEKYNVTSIIDWQEYTPNDEDEELDDLLRRQ